MPYISALPPKSKRWFSEAVDLFFRHGVSHNAAITDDTITLTLWPGTGNQKIVIIHPNGIKQQGDQLFRPWSQNTLFSELGISDKGNKAASVNPSLRAKSHQVGQSIANAISQSQNAMEVTITGDVISIVFNPAQVNPDLLERTIGITALGMMSIGTTQYRPSQWKDVVHALGIRLQ